MKRIRPTSARRLTVAAAAALALGSSAHAATATWNSTGTDFNTGANWTGGTGPGNIPGPGDNATFSSPVTAQPDLSAPLTIQGLTFSTATAGWTLSSAITPSLLTLTNTGTGNSSAINATNAIGTNTISAGLVLGGAAGTTATITQVRGGTLILSGNISSTNAIAGLTFASSGTGTSTITLSGNNTYSGATTIGTNGQLNIGSANAISTGTLVFSGNATIENTSATSALTLPNNNILLSGGSLTYGTAASTSSLNFGTGTVAMSGANRTFTINGTATITIAGVAPDASNTTRSFSKGGTGTLIINGAAGANFGGGLGVTAGTLIIGNKAAGGTGTFTLGGGTLQASVDMSGAANRLANNFLLSGTTTLSGTNNIELGGKLTGNTGGGRTINSSISNATGSLLTINDIDISNDATTARTLTIGGTGNTIVNGIIANGTGTTTANGLVITSTGLTTLANPANSFTGGVTLNNANATLQFSNPAVLGSGTITATTGRIQGLADLSGANKIPNAALVNTLTAIGNNSLEFGGKVTGNAGGNRTITNNLTTGTLILNNVDLNNDNTTARTLTFNGTGNTVVNGTIANGAASIIHALVVQGSAGSSVIFNSGSSTYSGGTTLTTTTATFGIGADSTPSAPGSTLTSGPIGTGNFTFTNGTLMAVGGPRTIANPITSFSGGATIGGTNDLTLNGSVQWTGTGASTFTVNNTGTTTFGGTFMMRNNAAPSPNGNRTVTMQGTGNVVFSGAITNGFSLNGALNVNSTGITTLSGNNTFSGVTTIGNGLGLNATVKLGHPNALGFGGISNVAGGAFVSAGSTLDLNGQTSVNKLITLNGSGIGGNGALINGNASVTASVGSGVSGINISGGASGGGLGYSAPPAVTITGGNGSGATAVALLGITTASFTIDSGTQTYTVAPTITITGGGGQGAAATAVLDANGLVIGITVLDGSTGPANDSRGTGFTSAPTIAFSGGTVLIAGTAPSGTGNATNFQVAAIQMTAPGTGYTGTPSVSIDAGTSTQAAAATAVPSSVVLNNATTLGGAGDLVISSPVTGAGGLTKVGNGKLILGAANGYIGATTVNAGTLLVNGSITGSATVNAGALGGTGSISSVEVLPGATLRGGDGVNASGGLTSSNVLILDDGATIALTLGPGGTHSSLISAAGFFAFDQTAQGFLFNSGASTGFYDNIIVGLTGSEPGLDDIAHWVALNPEYAGSTFTYDGLGNVDLNLTAVPEPATTLTMLSGLGLLLAFQRRRRA